jgi:hypothetical protein
MRQNAKTTLIVSHDGARLSVKEWKAISPHAEEPSRTIEPYVAPEVPAPTETSVRATAERTENAHRIVIKDLSAEDFVKLESLSQPIHGVVDHEGMPLTLTAWSPSDFLRAETKTPEKFTGISGILSRDITDGLAEGEAAYYIVSPGDEAHIRATIARYLAE